MDLLDLVVLMSDTPGFPASVELEQNLNHCCPKQPIRPGAALILFDMRCQKLECKNQLARPRAGGANDSSPGQAKRSPG
jgi:hypothetical protein